MSCTTTETITELCYHASGVSNASNKISRGKDDIVHLKALPYENNSSTSNEIVKDLDLVFPDGGLRAWLVVAGAWFAMLSSGFVNGWGVFQAYYESNLLVGYSSSSIAWIGSTQYALSFGVGVFTGRLFDIGIFHYQIAFSSVLLVVSTLLIGQCTEYWQLFLCQGIGQGLASGCLFGPPLAVISHWFKARRSTAIGIAISSTSVSGAIFPILIQNLIPKIGFTWTVRVMALALFVSTLSANLLLRRRLPPMKAEGGFFNFKAFLYRPFAIYALASFTCFLGLYTVLTYIDISAAEAGVSPSFDAYFIVIANAVPAVGRILVGALCDRVGCLAVLIPCTFVAAIMTYAWPFARNFASLLSVSILYGLSSGIYIGLMYVPLMQMGDTADVGRRSGILCTTLAFAALAGLPISGAIAERTGGFESVGYYAGSAMLVAAGLMWYVRYLMTGKIVGGLF